MKLVVPILLAHTSCYLESQLSIVTCSYLRPLQRNLQSLPLSKNKREQQSKLLFQLEKIPHSVAAGYRSQSPPTLQIILLDWHEHTPRLQSVFPLLPTPPYMDTSTVRARNWFLMHTLPPLSQTVISLKAKTTLFLLCIPLPNRLGSTQYILSRCLLL